MSASPGGVEVGRVSVRVLPDTSRLFAELDAELKRIEARTELKVNATIDSTRLDAEARAAVDAAQVAAGDVKIGTKVDSASATRAIKDIKIFGKRLPTLKPKVDLTSGLKAQLADLQDRLNRSRTQLNLDTSEARLKVAQLDQEIAATKATLKVTADDKEAKAKLEALTKTRADIQSKVNLDTAQARFDAAKLVAEIDRLKATIKVELDRSNISEAENVFSRLASSASGFAGSLGGAIPVIAVLATALVPLTAAVVGLGAALVAPLAIVGGGLTVFGFMAGFTIKETQKQLKAISVAQTKLDGLTKGTAAYTAAAADLKAKQAALTPAQKAYAAALTQVKSAFDKIPKTIVLTPITDGLKLLAHVLPLVQPILKAVSGVITDIIGQFDKSARSQGFKDFVTAFAKQLGPDLRAFATIAGNVFHGLFGLFGAFNKQLSGSVLKSLENLTSKFATWGQTLGQSKGFKSFVDYVRRIGPKVGDALSAIAGALGHIVKAAAPVGDVVLKAITGIAKAVQKIPPRTLTLLIGTFAGLVLAAKAAGPISLILEALAAPEIALAAVAVVALVGGFILLYRHSKPLRQILGDLGDFFKTQLLPVIKKAAEQVMPALRSAFQDISKSIRDNKPFLEIMGKLLLTIGSATVVTGILALVGAIRLIGKAVALGITVWHLWADAILMALRLLVGAFSIFLKSVLFVLGTIVDAAAAAFGWIPGIGGKIKGAQSAFHTFADHTVNDLNKTAAKLKAIQDLIDGVKPKTVTITVNTVERVTGPGGGMGRHATNDANTAGPNSKTGGDTYNIQAHDYADFQRQQRQRRRARHGGGVQVP